MSSSLREGLKLRRGDDGDLESVTELLAAEERALHGESRWTQGDTRDWFHDLGVDGELWIVEETGRPLAVLGVQFGDAARGWISVDLGSVGRGIGSELRGVAEERARTRRAAKLWFLADAENTRAIRALEGAGYCDVRHFYRMEIEFEERPDEPVWPDGIECTTFDVKDARAVHEALDQALADDFGHHPLAFERWRQLRLESTHFDPSLWFIACAPDEIAGVCRCSEHRWGSGWIDALGVRRPWRRRGIGRALLQRAFGALYDRGQRCVGLGVDAQNPSGATRLYEGAGMEVVAERISFEKVFT
jgi:ribosomal protein S18 acetylase RimI-like enzyme